MPKKVARAAARGQPGQSGPGRPPSRDLRHPRGPACAARSEPVEAMGDVQYTYIKT
jgi:hypothetical protein